MFDGPVVGVDVSSVGAEVGLELGALDGFSDGSEYERLPPPQKQHATHEVDFE